MLGYSPGCNKDNRVPSALSHKLEKRKIRRCRRDLHPSKKGLIYASMRTGRVGAWANQKDGRNYRPGERVWLCQPLPLWKLFCWLWGDCVHNFCLSISFFSSILRSIVSYRANNLKPTSDFIGQDDEVAGKRHWVSVIMPNWKTASLFALRQIVTRAFYAKRRFLHSIWQVTTLSR